MKKVLVLTSTFPLDKKSSLSPFLKNLCLELAKKTKLSILLPDHPKLKTYDLKNIKVYTFKYFFPRSWQKLSYGNGILPTIKSNPLLVFAIPPYFISQFIATRKIIKQKNIDIILANWAIPSGLAAVLAAYRSSTKVITYLLGSDANINELIYQCLLRFTLSQSSSVIAVSDTLVNQAKKILPVLKARIIPQGIAVEEVKNKKRKKQILFVGRLIRGKGAKNLILAFAKVQKQFDDYRLLIVGEGKEKKKLERLVSRQGIKGVLFSGKMANETVRKIMSESKLLVFPSRLKEGLPNVLLEAAAQKLPIISTLQKSKLFSEKFTTIAKPDPESLAKKIKYLITNYPIATKKSQAFFVEIKKNLSIEDSAIKIIEEINKTTSD